MILVTLADSDFCRDRSSGCVLVVELRQLGYLVAVVVVVVVVVVAAAFWQVL